MTNTISVFVPGTPAPQGSKRAFRNQHTGRIQMVESSSKVKTWRADIRDALLGLSGECAKLEGPVDVHLVFVIARPKGHYRTGRNAHLLRTGAPVAPTGKPDIDKLARAVLDAVSSAGVWGDDAQVVDLSTVKRYAIAGERAGVHITIDSARWPARLSERETDPEVLLH